MLKIGDTLFGFVKVRTATIIIGYIGMLFYLSIFAASVFFLIMYLVDDQKKEPAFFDLLRSSLQTFGLIWSSIAVVFFAILSTGAHKEFIIM